MSVTTVKAIWPNERVENLKRFGNGWGSGPAIWNELCEKYLGNRHAWGDAMWALVKDERVPEHQRAVLRMTFDRVMVMKADYAQAASDIRAWFADFPRDHEVVNHWEEIAAIFESSPECPAIGFQLTSESTDLWRGEWDEETELYGPPAWEKAWSLYDRMRATPQG